MVLNLPTLKSLWTLHLEIGLTSQPPRNFMCNTLWLDLTSLRYLLFWHMTRRKTFRVWVFEVSCCNVCNGLLVKRQMTKLETWSNDKMRSSWPHEPPNAGSNPASSVLSSENYETLSKEKWVSMFENIGSCCLTWKAWLSQPWLVVWNHPVMVD